MVFLGLDKGHDGPDDFGFWGKSKTGDHYMFPLPPKKGDGKDGEESKEGESKEKQKMRNGEVEGKGEGEGEGEGGGEGDKDKDKEEVKYEKRMWDQPNNLWTVHTTERTSSVRDPINTSS